MPAGLSGDHACNHVLLPASASFRPRAPHRARPTPRRRKRGCRDGTAEMTRARRRTRRLPATPLSSAVDRKARRHEERPRSNHDPPRRAEPARRECARRRSSSPTIRVAARIIAEVLRRAPAHAGALALGPPAGTGLAERVSRPRHENSLARSPLRTAGAGPPAGVGATRPWCGATRGTHLEQGLRLI